MIEPLPKTCFIRAAKVAQEHKHHQTFFARRCLILSVNLTAERRWVGDFRERPMNAECLWISPTCAGWIQNMHILWPLMFYRYAPSLHIWEQILQIDAYIYNKSANEWILNMKHDDQWSNVYWTYIIYMTIATESTSLNQWLYRIPRIYRFDQHVYDAYMSFSCTVLR